MTIAINVQATFKMSVPQSNLRKPWTK